MAEDGARLEEASSCVSSLAEALSDVALCATGQEDGPVALPLYDREVARQRALTLRDEARRVVTLSRGLAVRAAESAREAARANEEVARLAAELKRSDERGRAAAVLAAKAQRAAKAEVVLLERDVASLRAQLDARTSELKWQIAATAKHAKRLQRECSETRRLAQLVRRAAPNAERPREELEARELRQMLDEEKARRAAAEAHSRQLTKRAEEARALVRQVAEERDRDRRTYRLNMQTLRSGGAAPNGREGRRRESARGRSQASPRAATIKPSAAESDERDAGAAEGSGEAAPESG